MRPVVFLDIDGVLCIPGDPRPTDYPHVAGSFRPSCVEALNWLIDAADAQIVVSSAWRFIPGIAKILQIQGVKGSVIGRTPTIDTATRGQEIARWLLPRAPRKFVILDDDRDMDHLLPNLIQTEPSTGLTLPLAELALKILVP